MSGDLKWNKIMGAGLATAFVIIGVQQATGFIYGTEAPEKMGYFIDAPEEVEGGAAEVELPPDWGTVLPVADLAAGEAAFARCVACHTINQGGADGIGPNLYGVLGGAVMHRPGFAYSPAMQAHAAEAPTWGYDELDQFITAPNRYVQGTKMSFAGLRDTDTRVALIAYLRSQGSTGVAIPAPDPSRQPGAAPAEGEAVDGEAVAPGSETAAAGAGGEAGQTPTDGAAEVATEQATSPAQPAATSDPQT